MRVGHDSAKRRERRRECQYQARRGSDDMIIILSNSLNSISPSNFFCLSLLDSPLMTNASMRVNEFNFFDWPCTRNTSQARRSETSKQRIQIHSVGLKEVCANQLLSEPISDTVVRIDNYPTLHQNTAWPFSQPFISIPSFHHPPSCRLFFSSVLPLVVWPYL